MTAPTTPQVNPDAPFAERVLRTDAGGGRLYLLETPVRSVVTWRGSFLSFPDLAGGDELVQELAVMLLDRGTQTKDRFVLAEMLETLGAQLDFQSSGLRVRMSGRCLRDDLPLVFALMGEQLREPLFDPDEFEKAKVLLASGLRRQLESTAAAANTALAQLVYTKRHPNYDFGAADELDRLDALTLDDVRAYYDAHFGANDLVLAVTGDVDVEQIETSFRGTFGDWPERGFAATFEGDGRPTPASVEAIPMPDKANIDVRMGHTVKMRRTHDDFIPLYVGNYILGGNFSARLMNVVRDELGLTYGIHALLSGFEREHDGHWQINVTLSHDRLEEGLRATRDVVDQFVREGVTEEELNEKQTTITGSFVVGLATTAGLASTLLYSVERGFGPAYLDRFPDEVEELTVDRVNAVIREYLDPARLHVTMAGLRPEEEG